MSTPTIICLNGTSSSGKSTIAKALQARLEAAFLHVELDTFIYMMPASIQDDQNLFWDHFPQLHLTFHRALAAMACNANNMIIDDVLGPKGLRDIVEVFTDLDVVFVGVHCPAATLEAREQDRGDRHIGLAKSQLAHVHAEAIYDVEVETEELSPEECVARIVAFLEGDEPPTAFQQLREAFRGQKT